MGTFGDSQITGPSSDLIYISVNVDILQRRSHMVTVYISYTVCLGQVWPRRPAISAHIDIGHTASIYSGPMHGISIDSYILCLPFLAWKSFVDSKLFKFTFSDFVAGLNCSKTLQIE